MTPELWAGLAFFILVMAAVTVAGYIYLMRAHGRAAAQLPAGLSAEPTLPRARAAFMDMFRSLGENIPAAKAETNPYRARLALAGYRWDSAVPVFYGIKCASAMFVAGALDVFTLFYQGDLSSTLIPMICGGAVGYMLPDRFLSSRIKARAQRLRSGIPAALDLMTMGIEAGQSLDQSVADVSRGLRLTHPDLSAEFTQLYFELRASSSRASALRNLADRNKEPELRKLANLLVDSDRFGTSLGPALRSHVKYLRMRFRQQAQEAARKVGVKLIFPVFFLIFPSVLLVTLGPACIMMYKQLSNLLK